MQKKDGRYKRAPLVFDKSTPAKINLVGQTFGKLTVKEWAGKAPAITNGDLANFWVCLCECGDEAYNPVIASTTRLRSGNTRSCGCLTRTHGMSGTRLYNIWHLMIRRCTQPSNKDYVNYGGRGITVCDRWLESFENFYADMGERPDRSYTLDRKDNDAGYSPENCHWATRKEQCRNKRRNHLIAWKGETKTIAEWAEHPSLKALGIVGECLKSRLVLGWDFEEAMTTPLVVGKLITYQGETLTMMEWSRRLGAEKTNVVSKRLRRGWKLEDALTVPLRKW